HESRRVPPQAPPPTRAPRLRSTAPHDRHIPKASDPPHTRSQRTGPARSSSLPRPAPCTSREHAGRYSPRDRTAPETSDHRATPSGSISPPPAPHPTHLTHTPPPTRPRPGARPTPTP